jgi:hypothetical protein
MPRWPLMDTLLDIVAPVMYFGGRPKYGEFVEALTCLLVAIRLASRGARVSNGSTAATAWVRLKPARG